MSQVAVTDGGGFQVSMTLPTFLTPGDYWIMGYPESYGPRTRETLAAAPKFLFRVLQAEALPPGGGVPALTETKSAAPLPTMLALGVAVMLFGSLMLLTLDFHNSGRRSQGDNRKDQG